MTDKTAGVGPVERTVRPLSVELREEASTAVCNVAMCSVSLLKEAADEIDRLRSDLISCRCTVKTELHHYERQAMVHGKTPHGATYEVEAQRLAALLDRIDGLMAPNDKD